MTTQMIHEAKAVPRSSVVNEDGMPIKVNPENLHFQQSFVSILGNIDAECTRCL